MLSTPSMLTHLFNQPVAKNAEVKHLSQCVAQIANYRKRIHIDAIDLGCLVSEQGEHDGGNKHVQQKGCSVRISNGSHQTRDVREEKGKTGEQIKSKSNSKSKNKSKTKSKVAK